MGKKKRQGVIWSQDASSGSLFGRDLKVWDGVSRSAKRAQNKGELADRRELLMRGVDLKEEQQAFGIAQVKKNWVELSEYSRELAEDDLDHLLTQLNQIREMKRSGAKQRMIKHILANLNEGEWSILEKVLDIVDQQAI